MGEGPEASRASMGLGPGSRMAGYLLQEQIGRGGMAVVFGAIDEKLGRRVALKVLAPALAQDEAFRQRFIRESRAAAAVDDPHIIPVFQAGEADGVLFIAMRYVDGGDVGSLIARTGPMSPERVLAIISAVASCLDAAHAAGLVHRDIKPANLLLDVRPGQPDHVYLSDFGLSKGLSAQSSLTATGQFLGTLDYIAPEQIEGKQVDGRVDQYALACSTFEMLAGQPPFAREEAMAVMYAQLSAAPPALSGLRPELPPAADAVFYRALAKSPADRYPSCREFASALGSALAAGPPPASPAGADSDVVNEQTLAAWAGPARTTPQTPWPGSLQVPGGGQVRPQAPYPGLLTRPGAPPGQRGRRLAGVAIALVMLAGAAMAAIRFFPTHAAGGTPARHGHQSPPPVAASGCPAAKLAPANSSAGTPVRQLLQLSHSQANIVEGVAFGPDSKTVAIATFGASYLVDATSGKMTGQFTDPGGTGAQAVAFRCDGKTVAVADNDGSTYLWPVAGGQVTGQPVALASPAGAKILDVAFSADGRLLAASASDGDVYLWRISVAGAAGQLLTLADARGSKAQAVAFSPDGRLLAAGSASGDVHVWQLSATGQVGQVMALTGGNGSPVQTLAFRPDGKLLASGEADGGTQVWAVGPDRNFRFDRPLSPQGNSGPYGTVAVAFSPDGKRLAAGGYTGWTYVWDTATWNPVGQGLADQMAGFGNVQAVAFSPDGAWLATGDTQGGAYLWHAP